MAGKHNLPARPHSRRRKTGTIVLLLLLVITVICVLIGGFTLNSLIKDLAEYSKFRNSGKRVEARVIARRVDDDPAKTYYYLTYQFNIASLEQEFSQEAEVDDFFYGVYKEGTTVKIVYLPEDPSSSLLEFSLNHEFKLTWVLIIVILIIFFVLPGLLLLGWWWLFRRRIK